MGNSSFLKIQRFERNLSHHLLFLIIVDLFQLREFFAADLLYLCVSFLQKGHAAGTRVSRLSAAEAEFLLDAAFSFLRSELRDFNGIDDHSIGIMVLDRRSVGEGVVCLMGGL